MKYLILLSVLISGCNTFAGVAIHSAQDQPEYSGTNPMFIIRGEYKNGFCTHISSIPDQEKGRGLNMCGLGVRF